MKKRIVASALALSFVAPCAFAQNAVRISGFGTGALTWTNTDKAEFGRPNQAGGATKDVTTGVDSNFGVQADYAVNSWLSVTGQGLVRKDAQDDFGAELAWAFAKAKVSDDVSIRVGRMGLPAFMISDYRNVGYANTMLRPPAEVYSQMLFNTVDGADVTWQHSDAATTYTAQFAVGKTKADVAGGPSLDGRRVTALNLVAEHGPLTVRFGRVDGRLTLNGSASLTALLNTLNTVAAGYKFPQAAQLAKDIDVRDKKASFTSLGATLDWNDIVVQGEYAKRKTDSYINDTTSWYVMGGYRIGKFLPYYSHARLSIDGNVHNGMPAACPAGYPAACTPTLATLSGIVSNLRYTGVSQGEQQTDTIGLRWDVHSSVALKVQFDRVRPNKTAGLLIDAQPGFKGPVTVGAVALDFVF
ncbi:porin [Massilia sp. GER05]|uniref:porin n=1 Tax=Massilia sp. GER05 TaxID=3394605 RepID=UPI003F82C1B9